MIFSLNTAMKTRKFFVSELFEVKKGRSGLTRSYGHANPGKFPVYSASSKPLTNINTFDFEGDYLSWATNGYAGSMKILQGKFSINADRALLIPKNKSLNLDFFRLMLEPLFRKEAVGRRVDGKKNEYTKLSPEKALKISLEIPIDDNGEIDLIRLQEISEEWLKFEGLKNSLVNAKSLLADRLPKASLVDIKTVPLNMEGDWFEYINTKTGWTKVQLIELEIKNKKDTPVFSAAKGPIAYVSGDNPGIIIASKEKPLISFASNGDGSAGSNFIFHIEPMYISNDRTCIRILNTEIHPEYVFYALQGMKSIYGFNHSYKATKNNLTEITLEIPVSASGYDLAYQKFWASRTKSLFEIKKILIQQIDELSNSRLLFSKN